LNLKDVCFLFTCFLFACTDGTTAFDIPLNPPLVDDYEDEGVILEDNETVSEVEGAIDNNDDINNKESNESIQTFDIDNDDDESQRNTSNDNEINLNDNELDSINADPEVSFASEEYAPEYNTNEDDISYDEEENNDNDVPTHGYNLRPNRERNYEHKYGYSNINHHRPQDAFAHRYGFALHVMMTQMSAKKGLQLFGEKAADAIVKEFKQLHDKEVFIPRLYNSITPEERKKESIKSNYIDQS
jgi:hypothetical protein